MTGEARLRLLQEGDLQEISEEGDVIEALATYSEVRLMPCRRIDSTTAILDKELLKKGAGEGWMEHWARERRAAHQTNEGKKMLNALQPHCQSLRWPPGMPQQCNLEPHIEDEGEKRSIGTS